MFAHRVAIACAVVSLFGASAARSQDCSPEIVNTFDTPGLAQKVSIDGNLMAVGDNFWGVRFLDISDPVDPIDLSVVLPHFGAWDIALNGNVLAFVDTELGVGGGYLVIVDVTDERNPRIVYERAIIFPMTPTAVGAWQDIVAFALTDANGTDHRLELYDVSDPANPELLSVVSSLPNTMVFRDGLLYVGTSAGLEIFDVTDPTSPVLIGFAASPQSANAIELSGNYAYVTASSAGLLVFDISDPTDPRLVSNTGTTRRARDVAVVEQIAYVTFGPNPGGLDVFNVTSPTDPIQIGSITAPATALAVDVSRTSPAYLMLAGSVAGIHTIDISTCQPCPADLTGSSDPDEATYGVPDGDADSDDFFFYLDAFVNADLTICDIDGDADCDAKDFFAYLDLFADGC